MTKLTNSRSGQRGFTLVELAIVMIIIGLLIGGILKGQELVANARLASAVSKVKAIDAAMNTFRDSYSGVPGDLKSPTTRLPNCTDECAAAPATNLGDGKINTALSGGTQAAASENVVAWSQLAVTDLLGGIKNSATASLILEGGTTNPNAEVPGQFYIGYAANANDITAETATAAPASPGHYLLIHNGANGTGTSTAATAATTTSLSSSQASRIDTKLDDGAPNTGSVLAMGSATTCALGGASGDLYATAVAGSNCGLYVRIQQ